MSRDGASLAASILSSRVVLRAFSVWNASRFKPYGLSLHAKKNGRRCAAASRLAVFTGKTLLREVMFHLTIGKHGVL